MTGVTGGSVTAVVVVVVVVVRWRGGWLAPAARRPAGLFAHPAAAPIVTRTATAANADRTGDLLIGPGSHVGTPEHRRGPSPFVACIGASIWRLRPSRARLADIYTLLYTHHRAMRGRRAGSEKFVTAAPRCRPFVESRDLPQVAGEETNPPSKLTMTTGHSPRSTPVPRAPRRAPATSVSVDATRSAGAEGSAGSLRS